MIKKLVSLLDPALRAQLHQWRDARHIRKGTFTGDEPEFFRLHQWVSRGNTVLDLGANKGHYTNRLSQLVGPFGRVFAFEPVPSTFASLSANVTRFRYQNVTLINAAASSVPGILSMELPVNDKGIINPYRASVCEQGNQWVAAVTIDSLIHVNQSVRLIKIDVEGHEMQALRGMVRILTLNRPVLIVEENDPEIPGWLAPFGYTRFKDDNSPNAVYQVTF
jgi:FkbM family methyltransferase